MNQSLVIILLFFILMICLSSNSISLFLFLEFNSFLLSLILFLNNQYETNESIFVYYILNTLAFIFLLWGVTFCNEDIIFLSLILKLSFFPFLWWFPYMSDSITYLSFFILSVIQKVVPLFLIRINHYMMLDLSILLVLTSVIISLLNLTYNQNNLKVFLAWSSNINFSWILLILLYVWSLSLTYYFFYSLIFSFLLYSLRLENLFWDQVCIGSIGLIIIVFTSLFSFSGFPPFIGFYYKFIFFKFINRYNFIGACNGTIMLPLLIYCLLFTFLFSFNSFVYVNMLLKINFTKWLFYYNMFSYDLNFIFITYIFFGFYSFYI